MCAINPAGPFGYCRGKHFRFPEQFEANRCAHYINNGIDSAHFVEMHQIRGLSMDFSFGSGDS